MLPAEENENLFLEITDLDWTSAEFVEAKGVYVTFEVPLANGYSSYYDEVYTITDLKGRMLFPFQ
ncbi:MAG: hypothetical protein AAF741_19670 [Bacteroidota bacterium]